MAAILPGNHAIRQVVLALVVAASLVPATTFAGEGDRAEINHAGDAGRTWVLGTSGLATTTVRTDPWIPNLPDGTAIDQGAQLIAGDAYLFLVGYLGGERLVHYDLRRRGEIWSVPMRLSGPLASDGKRLFAVTETVAPSATSLGSRTAQVVAIEIETGRIVWLGPPMAGRFMESPSLVLHEEVIHAVDVLGQVVALDATTGDGLWQSANPLRTPTADEVRAAQGITLPPAIAATGEAVYVTQPGSTVAMVDAATGAISGTIDVAQATGRAVISATLQARAPYLVVTAIHDAEAVATILVLDATTLDVQHLVPDVSLRGNAVLAANALHLPLATGTGAPTALHRLDLVSGELTRPSGLAGEGVMYLSASGNTLMARGAPESFSYHDLDTGAYRGSVDLGHPGTPWAHPVLVWDGDPIVITPLGNVYVVTDDPVATPAGLSQPGRTLRSRAERSPGTGWFRTSASPSGTAGR